MWVGLDRMQMAEIEGVNFPPENHKLYGISGAPLFLPTYVTSQSKIISLKLAGVISQASHLNDDLYIIYASKISHINANGTINTYFDNKMNSLKTDV